MSTQASYETGSKACHLIGGAWTTGRGDAVTVYDKYRLQPCLEFAAADKEQTHQAIDAAQAAYDGSPLLAHERGVILERASALVEQRLTIFAATMTREAGFTKADASNEVRRCVQTLKLSGEEARRLAGEVIPLEGAPGQSGRVAMTMRVPLGVVAAITPFNAPLNTVAHKIGPALAAGNAVVLKPSSHTPMIACLLAQALLDAGLPAGWLTVLQGEADTARHIIADSRVRFFAFTGSTDVGRSIQQAAGLRRTQMELGSIAFTIVCDDADLDTALPKVVGAGYRKAGQVCTSVQMLLVQQDVMEKVRDRLQSMVSVLPFGDPEDDATVVGPVISEAAAIRIESWIEEAVQRGARRLVGGKRQGAVVPPTLLCDVDDEMRVGCREIFGPVVCLVPFTTLKSAIDRINATPYGLATGIFTNRLDDAFAAAKRLHVGAVHVNETSSSRVDLMPYGGAKDSGFGHEGPRYAIREMSEERVVTFTLNA
jgi:succinate-semialdehyde dehydrogenase/glutarate-semialdehyde dehydrogenase